MADLSQTMAAKSLNMIKPESNYRLIAVALCCGAVTINFVDRVNLSVAAPTIMKLFDLSAAQMGVLMSAFFWCYILMMMPSGALLNRIGAKMVMGWACLIWGATTMCTALVQGFNSFLALRILLGITESPCYPACARVVSVWIPKRERTMSTAAFDGCSRVGSAFAPPVVVWVILNYGWKESFIVTGGLAVLYAFVWFAFYHEPDNHPKVTKSELAYIRQDEVTDEEGKVKQTKLIPLLQLFTYKKFLLAALGQWNYTYFWGTFSTWIPAYLVISKGLDLKAMGLAAMYPYIAGVICEFFGGWVWDKWLQKGASLNLVRKTGMSVCLLGGAFFLYLAVASSSVNLTIIFLTASMGIYSFGAGNVFAIPIDIAPYGQGSGVLASVNTCGNSSSIVAPILTGYIITTSWGYDGAFYLVCFSAVIGAVCYCLNDYSRLVPKD